MEDEHIVYTEEFAYGWIAVDVEDLHNMAYGKTEKEALDNWNHLQFLYEVV